MSGRPDGSNAANAAVRNRRGFGLAVKALIFFAVIPALIGAPHALAVDGPGCPAGPGHAYTIGSGDVLQISVWQQESLILDVTVRPDGKISFPLIGDVQATGLTPTQLQAAMTEQLKRYLANPQVAVIVKEANSFRVSVLGEVHNPGRYQVMSDNTTVLDILAQAGGFTSYADKDSIGVLRRYPKVTRRIHFQYWKAVSDDPGHADFCVRPGDTIIVP